MTPALVLLAGLTTTAAAPVRPAPAQAEFKRLEGGWWLSSIGGCGTVAAPLHVFHDRRLILYTHAGARAGWYDVTLDPAARPRRMTLTALGRDSDPNNQRRTTFDYELDGNSLTLTRSATAPGGESVRVSLYLDRFRQLAPPPRPAR